MRLFILLSLFSTLMLSNSDCKKKKNNTDDTGGKPATKEEVQDKRYKGRLEVAGICKNYTITVQEGDIDPKLVAAEWTDETTQKKYTNAFRLGNPCAFPATIKAGDTFYFIIDNSPQQECMVCMAYYPTPSKALSIKVVE